MNDSLRSLRFRRAVRGSDLVALARLVEQGAVAPAAMSRAGTRLHRLLTPAVVAELKGIRFLDTGPQLVAAPPDAYIRSDRVVAILGENAPYAAGMPTSLLQRLGCRTEPRADDILAELAKLHETGRSLSRPDLVYRALVEAHVLSQLIGHPNVATVLDHWEEDEKAFMVSCYLSGGNLRDLIARSQESGEGLPVENILRISTEIADGLAYIHGRRILYRDLQPRNVLFDERDTVHLVDFDTAVSLDDSGMSDL